MFIAGNMSTGIRDMLTTPRIAMIRQATTMRYGVWIANRDIRHLRLRDAALCPGDRLRLHLLSGLQTGARAYDDLVAIVKLAGADFRHLRVFQSHLNGHDFDGSLSPYHENTRAGSRTVNGFHRHGQDLRALLGNQVD